MGFRLALFESQNIFSLKVLFLIELSEPEIGIEIPIIGTQCHDPNAKIFKNGGL